jgi:hypothetical protein
MPVLACNHHPGIVILAYYEKQPDGEWKPQIEERVREMLQPDLRRAIVAASR